MKTETEFTFEQLPMAVSRLYDKLSRIETLLLNQNKSTTPSDCWFNITELSNYIPDRLAKPTIYGLVSRREIPYHKRGKKLGFLKSEIDEWLKQSKRKMATELALEVDTYLTQKTNKK